MICRFIQNVASWVGRVVASDDRYDWDDDPLLQQDTRTVSW